jgi:hypothetical protein
VGKTKEEEEKSSEDSLANESTMISFGWYCFVINLLKVVFGSNPTLLT